MAIIIYYHKHNLYIELKEVIFLFKRRIMILAIFLVALFVVSAVSAADNGTDDEVSSVSGDISSDDVLTVESDDEALSQGSGLPETLSVSLSDDELLAGSRSFHTKTFVVGKYRGTFTGNQIKSVMKAHDSGYYKQVSVSTGKYVVSKEPIYKYKTKTKTVCFGKGKYTYGFWLDEYTSRGWKVVKTWQKGKYTDPAAGTMYKKCYAKFKKTVKVQVGVKKVKHSVKMTLSSHYEDGGYPGDNRAVISVWSSEGLMTQKPVNPY